MSILEVVAAASGLITALTSLGILRYVRAARRDAARALDAGERAISILVGDDELDEDRPGVVTRLRRVEERVGADRPPRVADGGPND
jgi:hypothetical protein